MAFSLDIAAKVPAVRHEKPERIENWDKFSRHMRKYILERTIDKYSTENAKVDLMAITGNPIICIWNVLKYTFRIWNGRMKEHDIEKIVHYAEVKND